MKYGLIGKTLKHSFSKQIHEKIAPYTYELCELCEHELQSFLEKRDFCAINVTIPYKEAVLPYLDEIDENAKSIGAVNTIVNRDGRLFGYNTDFFGLCAQIKRSKIEIQGKKVLVLGTGGTSRTACAVCSHLGARQVLRVSRSERDGAISYAQAKELHTDAQVIINTTPVGMYPNADGVDGEMSTAIDISDFPSLCAVVDVVYNPLRTDMILCAKNRSLAAEGGLYMLVSQAVAAYGLFFDTAVDDDMCEKIYTKIESQKENIVLVGMPSSGKSTVGKLIAKMLDRPFYDTDDEIVRARNCSISEIFENEGESAFRDLESKVIKELSSLGGVVIATGGGAVLRDENVRRLRRNGRIYFLDRPLRELVPTSDRPLAADKTAIEKRYKERYDIYKGWCDCRICEFSSENATAHSILEDFEK